MLEYEGTIIHLMERYSICEHTARPSVAHMQNFVNFAIVFFLYFHIKDYPFFHPASKHQAVLHFVMLLTRRMKDLVNELLF